MFPTMPRTASPFISTLLLALAAAPGLRAQGPAAPRAPRSVRSAAPRANAPPPLPDIPLAEGPLDLKVAYPPVLSQLGSSDSNFIFGQTGNGNATLSINGE